MDLFRLLVDDVVPEAYLLLPTTQLYPMSRFHLLYLFFPFRLLVSHQGLRPRQPILLRFKQFYLVALCLTLQNLCINGHIVHPPGLFNQGFVSFHHPCYFLVLHPHLLLQHLHDASELLTMQSGSSDFFLLCSED